jgi:hypothetical protein
MQKRTGDETKNAFIANQTFPFGGTLPAMFTVDLRLNFNTTIKIDLTNRKIENAPTRGTVRAEHAPLIEPAP